MRRFFSFFIPGGIILLAAVLCIRMNAILEWLPAIARIYPYAVLVIAIFLGLRFHRNRLIYGTVLLFLADRLLVCSPNSLHNITFFISPVTVKAVAILLPLNLLVFSLLKTRGLVTVKGIFFILLIMAQFPLISFAYRYQPAVMEKYLNFVFFPVSYFELPQPQPAMAAFTVVAVLMAFFFIRSREVMKQGFFWATMSVFLALATAKPGFVSTVYFSTAGLILVISAVEAIYGMAYHDELTKLPARRALNEALFKVRGNYSVAMIDIDYFKKFNDRYGHDVGDQVLCMVASKLASVTGGGKAFRYGGEEFVIVFPGRTKDKIIGHLENLRKTIASSSFKIRSKRRPAKKPKGGKKLLGSGRNVSVTVSIGIADRTDKQTKPAKVVKAADRALYKAKKEGRNRVVS